MAYKMDIIPTEILDKHQCTGEQKGEWIVFTCPECDYERRIHIETDEVETSGGDPDVLHRGMYVPIGINLQTNLN
jgi:hypothetical protein